MDVSILLYIFCVALFVAVIVAIRVFIKRHMLGTFKFDNSGETYRCLMEFDDLDDVEKHRFAIVRIKETNLGLPGERKSQH